MNSMTLLTVATSPPAPAASSSRADRKAFKDLKQLQTDAWFSIAPEFKLRTQFSKHISTRAFVGPQNAMHAALELTLEGMWQRDDLGYSDWGYNEMNPMLLLLHANPRFWHRLFGELLADELMWTVVGEGAYPHERLLRELNLRLTDTIEPSAR